MKLFKNVTAVLLVLAVIFSISACGKTNTDSVTENTTTGVSENVFTPDNNGIETYAETIYQVDTTSATYTQAPTTQPTTKAPETQAETLPPSTEAQTTEASVTVEVQGVGKYTGNYQGVEQTVFYPLSAEVDSKLYPVVIFANGTGFDYKIYENLLIKLAEGGYIVVANSETMAADGSAQIASLDFILSENNNSSSVLFNNIDTNKAAAAGHSQGGRSAVNAAAKDSRFDCVLSLAGSNFAEEAELLRTPALFMAGTRDMIVNADKWVKTAYDVCKGPAVYASLINGVHTSCCTNPETYTTYAIDWFDAWLKNDSAALNTFRNGGALSNDGAWTEFSCKGF